MCRVSPPEDANASLERQVRLLVLKSADSKDDDPVLRAASRPQVLGSVLRCGSPIYVRRSPVPVIVLSAAAVCGAAWSARETGPIAFALCVAAALAGYDLLSGALHVVFDDTRNLDLPVLGQPCLEFQMHHSFPTDLVQRDLLHVLGDLNTVTSLIALFSVTSMDFIGDPVTRCMGCLKLLMAYYGQVSHRMAHSPKSEGSSIVGFLRRCGVMIPLDVHRSHHRAPHDKDFCLVGVCNPAINFLYHKVTRNRWFWMGLFLSLGLGGIAMESMLMRRVLSSLELM